VRAVMGRAVFERTAVGRALSQASGLFEIIASPGGFQFDVQDAEGLGRLKTAIYFQTDRRLRLLQVNFSDYFRFQQEGLLRNGAIAKPVSTAEFMASKPMRWIERPAWLEKELP
jgi:hypothetical protein